MKHHLTSLTNAFLLAVALMIPAKDAPAQEPEQPVRVLAPNTWALQFAVAPNFMLDRFAGSTVAVQRQYTERRALRLGISVTADYRSTDTEFNARVDSEKITDLGTQLEILFLTYQETNRPVRYFGGIGPMVGVAWNRRSAETVHNGTTISESTMRHFDLQVGARTATGVKWIVHSQIGLFAEYNIVLAFRRESREAEGAQEITTNRIMLRGDGVRTGVSVFF